MPQYAQLVQNDLKAAGIDVKLNFTDSGSYYGDAVFGKSPWLDSTFGITEYGHRGAPNVFLGAPLKSDGTWNSAHFKNKQYDQLVNDYVAALDLQAQRAAAKKIQELLLDEVPIIFAYFYYYLTATKNTVAGVDVSRDGPRRRHPGGAEGVAGAEPRRKRHAIARFLAQTVRARPDHAVPAEHRHLLRRARCCPATSAGASSARSPTRRSVDALNEQLGTDRPLITQYLDWITSFLTGDLGTSARDRPPGDGGPLRSARGLRQAGGAGLHHRRAARDPRRRARGAARGHGRATG